MLLDFSIPCGLKGDPLAGLPWLSSSAPGLEFGSDPQTLSQARPQLYEPHTPLLTTKRNTQLVLVRTLHGHVFCIHYFFHALLRL